MSLLRRFLKRRFLTLALLLASTVFLRGVPAVAQSNSNYNDDGNFNVYTSIFVSGSSISAWASAPQPDFFETWGGYDVIGQPSWSLQGGSYSDSGEGYSFSSGPIPLGSTYSASFYFYVVYYGQAAYSGEGPSECVPGQLGDGDTCTGYDYPVGYASLDVPAPAPLISSITPSSANQGDQGTLTITGTNLSLGTGDQPSVSLDGHGAPFTVSGTPTSNSATFSYDFTSYPTGTYALTMTNNEGTSNGMNFTISSRWPANSCSVNSSPKSSYSAFTSVPGGSGRMTISFSGAAYSSVSQSVSYGPYSTPSSLASNIAALITANYTKSGLTARAFGSNIVYSGNGTLGTVIYTTPGPPIAIDTSPTAAANAEVACEEAPPAPPPLCGTFVSHKYVLAVTHDSVSWQDPQGYLSTGRNVNYSLLLWPQIMGQMGQAPPPFQSTVTEHLTARMSSGNSSSGTVSGEFDDVLGNIGAYQSGTYVTDRCFTVTSPTIGNLGQVLSYDAAFPNLHAADHIEITQSTRTSILNNWKNQDGSPKSVALP